MDNQKNQGKAMGSDKFFSKRVSKSVEIFAAAAMLWTESDRRLKWESIVAASRMRLDGRSKGFHSQGTFRGSGEIRIL